MDFPDNCVNANQRQFYIFCCMIQKFKYSDKPAVIRNMRCADIARAMDRRLHITAGACEHLNF
jgi:hypothetical protein